jgi:hypothetical protein
MVGSFVGDLDIFGHPDHRKDRLRRNVEMSRLETTGLQRDPSGVQHAVQDLQGATEMYPMLPTDTHHELSREFFTSRGNPEWPDDPFYQIPMESAARRPDPIWTALREDLSALGAGIRRGVAWIQRRPVSTTGCDRKGHPVGMS